MSEMWRGSERYVAKGYDKNITVELQNNRKTCEQNSRPSRGF